MHSDAGEDALGTEYATKETQFRAALVAEGDEQRAAADVVPEAWH